MILKYENGLTFEPEPHIYRFEGRIVPSVTQLLPKEKFFVSDERLDQARAEGVEQHRIQDDVLNNREVEDSAFADGVVEFLCNYGVYLGDLVLSETPLYSKNYRFAGTPDAVFSGGLTDRKRTRGALKRRALQFAGYWILLMENNIKIEQKWWEVVQVNGKDVPKNVYDPAAITVFHSLVQSYWNERLLNAYLRTA